MPETVVKGTRVHFLTTSKQVVASKPKILFVHGGGGNAGIWQKVMSGLEDEYQCLAIDLPGHGQSQGTGMTSISAYRGFLKDFLDVLGEREIILGGHSMGGGIALDFSLRYPEILKAILLIGTGGRLRVLPQVLERLRRMAEGEIPPRFEPWGFAEGASAEVIAEAEREWAKTNSKVRYKDMLACDQFDLLSRLEQIRLPTFIVCGREDLLTPVKYSEFLQRKVAGSKMEIIEGAGHMVMLENPGELSKTILRFLAFL